MKFINIADLVDPCDAKKRTYREVNADKSHKFKIGDLVEIENGCRLFITSLTRDCDSTPLYSLAASTEVWEVGHPYSLNGFSEHGMVCIAPSEADNV